MQFLIIAKDHTDAEALRRRMSARQAHLALSTQAIKRKEQLYAVAMLDDAERMCGSVMVVDFPSEKEVHAWLAQEPYVTGKVWDDIQIIPCKVGPSFVAE